MEFADPKASHAASLKEGLASLLAESEGAQGGVRLLF